MKPYVTLISRSFLKTCGRRQITGVLAAPGISATLRPCAAPLSSPSRWLWSWRRRSELSCSRAGDCSSTGRARPTCTSSGWTRAGWPWPSANSWAARRRGEVLGIERQKEMLGSERTRAPHRRRGSALSIREFWVKNVLQPAFDIMANPAATCELARSMLGRIVKMEHQAQIIGLAGLSFGDLGNPSSILGQAFSLARYRCLAEAFDECMATGNGQALIMAMSEWGRQIKITSPELEEAWERQVTYLFRRCTVYKLSYNMKLQDRTTRESSVVLGSFTLLFKTEGEGIAAFARGMWVTRQQEMMAPDVRVMDPDCGPDAPTCREKAKGGMGGAAFGIVQLRRDATEQSFEVVPFEPKPPLETRRTEGPNIITDRRLVLPDNAQNLDLKKGRAWTMLHTTRHREGKDSLFMNFGPPLTQMNAISAGTGGNVEMADANGTGLYYMANGKEMGEYPTGHRRNLGPGAYPKLYSAGHAAAPTEWRNPPRSS